MLLHRAVAAALLALPWLWPWTGGPSVAVVPWLATLGSAALWMLWVAWWGSRGTPPTREAVVLGVLWSWLLAAGVSALIGGVQHGGVPSWAAEWINRPSVGEVYGNLRQRNQFASLMNIGLAALLGLLAWPGAGTRARAVAGAAEVGRRGPGEWVAAATAALLVAGNVLSRSRTGLAELVLLCALAWVWAAHRPRGVRRLVLALLPMYAGFSVALSAMGRPAVWQRMVDDMPACSSRITLWRNVLELIAQKPWGGWGWGELDYAHYAHLYGGERFCDILDNAHNLPLHLAVELGLPLALAACALVAWGLWRGQPWREAHPARQLAWSVLAVLALHSLLEYPLWYGPFQLALWLALGVLWRVPRQPHPPHVAAAATTIATNTAATANYEQNRPSVPVKWRLFAIVLILMMAGTAWDYHRISQLYRLPEERAAAYRTDTLAKVSGSWLFDSPVAFAAITTTPLTPGNAAQQFAQASALLHYSPEPRIIERVIESAVMLHRDDAALWHLARFRAAFPVEHAAWAAALARPVSTAAGAGAP